MKRRTARRPATSKSRATPKRRTAVKRKSARAGRFSAARENPGRHTFVPDAPSIRFGVLVERLRAAVARIADRDGDLRLKIAHNNLVDAMERDDGAGRVLAPNAREVLRAIGAVVSALAKSPVVPGSPTVAAFKFASELLAVAGDRDHLFYAARFRGI